MAVTKVSSKVHFVSHGTTGAAHDGGPNGRWVPNTDIYVTPTGLVIKAELAGMKSDSLEITIEGNEGRRLRISGSRPDCCREHHCNFLVMEITYGPFEAVLDLPSGYDLSLAKAMYVNGFLRIDVPTAHIPQPKTTKIPIN